MQRSVRRIQRDMKAIRKDLNKLNKKTKRGDFSNYHVLCQAEGKMEALVEEMYIAKAHNYLTNKQQFENAIEAYYFFTNDNLHGNDWIASAAERVWLERYGDEMPSLAEARTYLVTYVAHVFHQTYKDKNSK